MAGTRISELRLVALRAEGHADANRTAFVDPVVLTACLRVLDRRGEEWAASVLGRDIRARSRAVPDRPFLRDGEADALVAADREEDAVALAALQ
jgi:hypothetical protein